ncbi:hypothetical protein L6259_00450 [Candidatus Parcubacteria bacterium]|nr:hypothetical protein [Patescibacteria group bacterium]MCG2693744.1 hypothetical protein [Candidatus Parcubacteria bacterium]
MLNKFRTPRRENVEFLELLAELGSSIEEYKKEYESTKSMMPESMLNIGDSEPDPGATYLVVKQNSVGYIRVYEILSSKDDVAHLATVSFLSKLLSLKNFSVLEANDSASLSELPGFYMHEVDPFCVIPLSV